MGFSKKGALGEGYGECKDVAGVLLQIGLGL